MKNYDVIVIGSGNGGLAAALKVLKAGKTCLVLEKHNIPGGFATSFKRGRFEFEASLHEFNGIGTKDNLGSCGKLFEELGVLNDIEFVQLDHAYRLISLDEKIDFRMPLGVDNCLKAIKEYDPSYEPYAKQFFDLANNISEAINYLGISHGKPDPQVLMTKYYDYMAVSSYSVKEVFDTLKFPLGLQAILNAYWCYLGASAEDMNFVHYSNMVNSYLRKGACVPTNRSHGMSLAFVNQIHKLGGDIYFNSEVTNILMNDDGSVKGVKIKNGTEYYAKHVIANCSPNMVYGKMIDKKYVPKEALKLTNFRKFAGRGFTVFLGLNKSPEELGITDHSYFIYQTSDNIKTFEEMGKLYNHAGQASVCLNKALPDCSPKGTTILYITTLFTTDCWKDVKPEDYQRVKNEVANNLITQFEQATGVNLKDNIEEISVATPLTYARYCGHPQGTIYGYHSQYRDGLMARIQMVNDDAFIKGLRIGGGFGERLLGYPSSYKSGYNEASRTLKDIEKETM